MANLLISDIEYGFTGTRDGARFEGAIRVENGLIKEIGNLTPKKDETIVSAKGCVVTPGLVNTHHHLFQSLLKAVPDGLNEGLDIWLQKVPYAFWPYFTADILATSAKVGLSELLLTGATTISDHHYVFSPEYEFDPAHILFEEANKLGIRFLLARGGGTKGRDYFDDPTMPKPFRESLAEFLDNISKTAQKWHDPSPFSKVRMAVAPTTPTFNVQTHELEEIATAARAMGLRLHSHLSENKTYVDYTLQTFGKRPVPFLADKGWLGEDVWFAHLVEIDDDEIAQLIETGTGMAHCTQANARLGSGIAPADIMHDRGGLISIGVDGAGANEAADMGAAMYSAFVTHRAAKGAAATKAETILHWATKGGADVLGFDKIGTLEVGMAADIAIFDISHPRNMGLHDPGLSPIISGAALVRDSFVGGNAIVINGQIPDLDMVDLRQEAFAATRHLIEKRMCALKG